MSMFSLLIFCGVIMSGLLFAEIFGFYWQGICSKVVGFIGGCLSVVLILWIIHKINDKWLKFHPLRPPCKNGRCLSDDYELIECLSGDELIYRCKCGDKYLRKGLYFMELLEDGKTRPYMRRKGHIGKWEIAADGWPG